LCYQSQPTFALSICEHGPIAYKWFVFLLLLQAELAASRRSLGMQEAMMRKMSEQLLKEGEAVIALKAELAKEQAAAKSLRDKLSKVGVKQLTLQPSAVADNSCVMSGGTVHVCGAESAACSATLTYRQQGAQAAAAASRSSCSSRFQPSTNASRP
jgi:hypothetical protein